ncbi:MAG: hypothetical protein ACLUMK_12090 [Christensenellales bacterium]
MSDGERALAKRQFPEARIIEVTNMRTQSAACAGRLLPSDDALRQLYKALRQRERTDCTPNVLSAAIGLDESTILMRHAHHGAAWAGRIYASAVSLSAHPQRQSVAGKQHASREAVTDEGRRGKPF